LAEHSEVLAQLLNRARRRRLQQLIAEQSGVAVAAALVGAVALLLGGTQILDWYWPVILFGGSLAIGIGRTLRRLPSRYVLAQEIDVRLGLYDAVSTAYNFETSSRSANSEFLQAQKELAEKAARKADLRIAFPFVMPKAIYGAGGIALVVFGMLALRYAVTRSLDLRPSLARIVFDTFFQPDGRPADSAKSSWRKKLDEELQKLGINMNATDAKPNERDPAPDSALAAPDNPEQGSSADSDKSRTKTSNLKNEQESSEPGGDEKTERASASGADQQGAERPPEGNDGQPQNGQQASSPKGAKESNTQNSSLMDKMRDAMSNLMNKLKMGSKSDSKQSAQSQGGQPQRQGKSDKGQMAGKQQSSGEAQDQQGQQQNQGDQSQSAKGNSGNRDADKQAAQDSKSGIGKQDGDKSAREAEQLAAMGKISEILGKRAKDMSGEVMVEVSGGKQQLKTQYSSNNAAHAEAGGEISRDEVPMEYQEYVQQYFERIRKTPAASKTTRPAQ